MNNTDTSLHKDDPNLFSLKNVRKTISNRRPLLLVHARDAARDIVLSRIAAEVIGEGGRVFWATSNTNVTPMAWAMVSTSLFNMADVGSLPRVAPFSLDMVWAARWLAYALEAAAHSTRTRLARAVGQLYAEGGIRSYEDGLRRIREHYSAYLRADESDSLVGDGLVWYGGAHRFAADQADEDFGLCQLTVFSGSKNDFSLAGDALVLAVLRWVSGLESSALDQPALLVLDEVLDALSPGQRELLRIALLDHAGHSRGISLVAVSEPVSWEYDDALISLLASGIPLITPAFSGGWPVAWGDARPEVMAGMDLRTMIAVPSSDRKGSDGHAWRWLRVMSPVAAPIPGVVVRDVEYHEQ